MARPSLFTHRKFAHLEDLLGSRIVAVGVLELIWQRAYADGDPVLGRPEIVEHSIGWDGEVGSCVSALVESGFVDLTDDGQVTVHDLDDHAPSYVKKRKARESERRQRPANDRSVTGQRQTVTPPPAPAPAPAPAPKTQPADAGGEYPAEFEKFWDQYPLKKKKGDALKAWKQVGKKRPPLDALLSKLDALKASKDWTKDGGQFIPYPATWLRADGWEDEVRAPAPANPAMRVGAPSDNSVWMFETYLRADMEAHGDHERWTEYVANAANYPPRQAPTFETWLEV